MHENRFIWWPKETEAHDIARRPQVSVATLSRVLTKPVSGKTRSIGTGLSPLKIIAAILEQPVIEKIRTHMGLQAQAPPRAPARGQVRKRPDADPTVTVLATRRTGPLESAASEDLRRRWMRPGGKG